MSHAWDLHRLGWDDELGRAFEPYGRDGLSPGRIAVEHRDVYLAYAAQGELWAEVSGRLRFEATSRADLPAAGDWVALRPLPGEARAIVHAVLPRRTAISRKAAGHRTDEQVLAANVDAVWICVALTRELAARRVERFLAAAWDSGAHPVVVLTKADLDDAPAERVDEVMAVAAGADVVRTSAVTGQGIEELRGTVSGGRTAALLGSSGVGKSTLVNALVGAERQWVQETRADDVGRHTTTTRELVVLPGGGSLIDTPGLRELVLWDDDGLGAGFADVEALADTCRFRDCSHIAEPGCAIRSALASGELDAARWDNYVRMQREIAHLERRKDARAAQDSKKRWKAITKAHRQRQKLQR